MSTGNDLNVEPGDLLVTADGHMLLIGQLGQVLDVTPSVAGGPWPSQAGVALMHGTTSALTASMMARLGEHSAGITSAAGQYTAQEGDSAKGLGKEALDAMKDMLGMGTGLVKDMESTVGSAVTSASQAVSSLGGAAASGAASMIGPMVSAAKPEAHAATPLAATAHAAAPQAHDNQDQEVSDELHAHREPSRGR